MTEDQGQNHPQPPLPAGFQRPGVPGAGNILDPAVRGDLRGKLREAVQGAGQQVREQQKHGNAPQDGVAAETPRAEEKKEDSLPAEGYRAGPYPHGDVDLRGFVPNVPPEPVKPNRGRAGRRFYFLTAQPATQEATTIETPTPQPGPKPG